MFSIWRIRISAITVIIIVSALIRGGSVWLRQFNAQTPISALDVETYVETITPLLERVQTQLYTVLNTYDDLSAKGEMTALVYNYGVREIVAKAEALHRTANKIRSIHPPQVFASYHAETLQALAASEGALVKLMQMADGGPKQAQAEQDELARIFNEATAALNTYPSITSHTVHERPLATLNSVILNTKSHGTPTPPLRIPKPNTVP